MRDTALDSLSEVVLPERVTVCHANKRPLAEEVYIEQCKQFPDANVQLSGRPGSWKVRRNRQEGETEVLCWHRYSPL